MISTHPLETVALFITWLVVVFGGAFGILGIIPASVMNAMSLDSAFSLQIVFNQLVLMLLFAHGLFRLRRAAPQRGLAEAIKTNFVITGLALASTSTLSMYVVIVWEQDGLTATIYVTYWILSLTCILAFMAYGYFTIVGTSSEKVLDKLTALFYQTKTTYAGWQPRIIVAIIVIKTLILDFGGFVSPFIIHRVRPDNTRVLTLAAQFILQLCYTVLVGGVFYLINALCVRDVVAENDDDTAVTEADLSSASESYETQTQSSEEISSEVILSINDADGDNDNNADDGSKNNPPKPSNKKKEILSFLSLGLVYGVTALLTFAMQMAIPRVGSQ